MYTDIHVRRGTCERLYMCMEAAILLELSGVLPYIMGERLP